MTADLAQLETLIRGRRTVKTFTGAPLDPAVVTRCLDLARWAPTHRLHQPWRFVVLDQPAIVRLDTFLADRPDIAAWPDAIKGPGKLAKLRDRLPTLGAMIQATWVRHADPEIDREDLAAASAAIEHVLLGVQAAGLASFWSSSAALRHPDTLRWCGCDPDHEGFLGSLWLGHAAQQPPVPQRLPLEAVVRWL